LTPNLESFNMTEIILLVIVLMMVPKIISGIKEGIRFAGRVIGWGIAALVFFYLIKTFYL